MNDREWIERAQEAIGKIMRRGFTSGDDHEALKTLLAEPAEPAYKAGKEIPGWVAAKLASEGRAEEVEWRHADWLPYQPWASWDMGEFTCKAAVSDNLRFRLRPAPTQPEPTPREAFEEIMEKLEALSRREMADGTHLGAALNGLCRALRALADEVWPR